MTDFPTLLVPGTVAPDDQVGQVSTDRAYIPGIGTTAYWDPPNNPVPLARAPAGKIGLTDGSRDGRRLSFFQRSVSATANTTWGRGGAGLALSREVNRRAIPAHKVDRQTVLEQIPSVKRGGLAVGLGAEWFEQIVVFPTSLALGNVLSTQVRTIEIYNSFRRPRQTVQWTTFVNNVGVGVDVTNLPGLPFPLVATEGFIADVQISTAGPPSISGTLDFTFGPPQSETIPVPVTGNRITIFQYIPQAPIGESLQFKTDILKNNDGSEQRVKVRNVPRQLMTFTVRTDAGLTRDQINAVLFDWQARVFGVPIWFEQRPLDSDILIAATDFDVDTSAADYRVDSLVMIWESNQHFEVLEIASLTATNIVTKTPFAKAFTAGIASVMPVRTAYTRPALSNTRFAIGPSDFKMEFEILDNVDLASLGAFNTYQGVGQTIPKPILDGFNFMGGATIGEGNRRRVERLDVLTGPPIQYSPWTKGKPIYQFGFEAKSFDEVFEWRQLAHYLRGSQLSFYVPTGRTDLKPIGDVLDTATFIDVQNFGFTNFIQEVTPRSDLRFVPISGTPSVHQITASQEQSATVERISFSPAVSPGITLANLDRVEFVTLCRIDSDKVDLIHGRPGESRIQFNLIGVPA
jgi:hypothetical protein